jgi:pimeloyl-ACP methyl ester carboxylesterase
VRTSLDSAFGALLLVAAAAAAGCASPAPDPVVRRHIVMVDRDGALVDPVDGEVIPDGTPSDTTPTPRDRYIEEILEAMVAGTEDAARAGRKRKVVLYVHGGLNSPEDGIRRCEEVLAELRKPASPDDPAPYPIFLNWNSSFGSCYADYTFRIRQGKDRSRASLWILASPFYFVADVLRGIATAPLLWFREIEVIAGGDTGETRDADQRTEWYRDNGGIQVRRGSDGSAGVLETVQRGVFLPVRGVTLPFVHGFGTSSWETMKRRIAMMVHSEEEFTAGKGLLGPRGALHRFLERLRDRLGDGDGWDVALVGHSMGAIVMNQMLREVPDIHYSRIVYMAAACSIRDYADTVVPYMRLPRNADTRMVHLSLCDRAERSEKYWEYVDVVPRGTLLLWIDNYLTTPPTRLDRSAGRYVNLVTAPPSIFEPGDVAARTLLWQFDGGDPDAPQRHEDFDEVRFRFWEDGWWARRSAP